MKYYLRQFLVRGAVCFLVLLVLSGVFGDARAFDDCGTLMSGYNCPILFAADGGGIFLLDNYGGFIIGKYVRVVGTGGYGPAPCYMASGWIRYNTITWCVTPVKHTTWGRIKALYTIPLDFSRRGKH